jgi:phosphoribosyl-dephospho-CoA transferase
MTPSVLFFNDEIKHLMCFTADNQERKAERHIMNIKVEYDGLVSMTHIMPQPIVTNWKKVFVLDINVTGIFPRPQCCADLSPKYPAQ